MEAHGGVVSLQSEEGVGSRFSFTLPLSDSSPGSPGRDSADVLSVGSGVGSKRVTGGDPSSAVVSKRGSRTLDDVAAPAASPAGAAPASPAPAQAADASPGPMPPLKAGSAASLVNKDLRALRKRSVAASADAFLAAARSVSSSDRAFFSEQNSGIQILSVDDDGVNQLVIDSTLTKEGYEVVAVMDGTSALDYLRSAEARGRPPRRRRYLLRLSPAPCSRAARQVFPDLVLLDVTMPDMSGHEVAAEVRKWYPRTPLPIIMISAAAANGNDGVVVEGLQSGANDFIHKPFKRAELLARIETQLRLRDMSRLQHEANASLALLQRMLPAHVIARLKSGETPIADSMGSVTVLFSDVVSFTKLVSRARTTDVIHMLNELFTAFDELVDKHGCYKVETIGDAASPRSRGSPWGAVPAPAGGQIRALCA